MATTLQELKDQLDDQQETLDQVCGILEEAYTPEATRADLVTAISQALEVLSGDEEIEEDEEDEEDQD